MFAPGGVDVDFESVIFFIYFISWEKTQVLTPARSQTFAVMPQARDTSQQYVTANTT
jgi:hypothetical protein